MLCGWLSNVNFKQRLTVQSGFNIMAQDKVTKSGGCSYDENSGWEQAH
jgi:hypothetical protein